MNEIIATLTFLGWLKFFNIFFSSLSFLSLASLILLLAWILSFITFLKYSTCLFCFFLFSLTILVICSSKTSILDLCFDSRNSNIIFLAYFFTFCRLLYILVAFSLEYRLFLLCNIYWDVLTQDLLWVQFLCLLIIRFGNKYLESFLPFLIIYY